MSSKYRIAIKVSTYNDRTTPLDFSQILDLTEKEYIVLVKKLLTVVEEASDNT